mgnify:CR=1 FL=1
MEQVFLGEVPLGEVPDEWGSVDPFVEDSPVGGTFVEDSLVEDALIRACGSVWKVPVKVSATAHQHIAISKSASKVKKR